MDSYFFHFPFMIFKAPLVSKRKGWGTTYSARKLFNGFIKAAPTD